MYKTQVVPRLRIKGQARWPAGDIYLYVECPLKDYL